MHGTESPQSGGRRARVRTRWLRALFGDGRRVSAEPQYEVPNLICPHCGRLMRVSRNPFYGIDMSVHDTVAECARCNYSVLINLRHRS